MTPPRWERLTIKRKLRLTVVVDGIADTEEDEDGSEDRGAKSISSMLSDT